jgi:hypothetical protein
MTPTKKMSSFRITKSLLIFVFVLTATNALRAQQNIRDNFLVDKISRYESSSNYASAEYVYDTDNKLQKRIITGEMFEQGQVRPLKYIDEFEYENGLVSKIKIQDLTHFMFSYDIHLLYNSKEELIRQETWMNGFMIGHSNYHYEDGRVVSIYNDNIAPFEFDTIFYDNYGNITKYTYIYPITDMLGQPIPGEFGVRELYYEYDDSQKPNFGLDYLFVYQLIPWMGTAFPCEIMNLSNNNMTKAIFEQQTHNYTYNEHGLPATLHNIFDPIGPLPGSVLTITYRQIGETSISEVTQEMAKIIIYPNPAKDKFWVDFGKNGIMTLYDMFGKEVLNQNINKKTEININHLPKGIYIVRVVSESKIIGNSKIVKQ